MKKMVMGFYIFIQMIIFLVLVPVTFAGAFSQSSPPPLPSSYYGILTADNESLSSDITVSAYINKIQYAQTTIFKNESQWVYTLKIPADNPSTEAVEGGRPGDTITFYIGDRVVTTAPWLGGANSQLDMTMESVVMAQTGALRPFNIWLVIGIILTLILVALIVRYRRFIVAVVQSRYTDES